MSSTHIREGVITLYRGISKEYKDKTYEKERAQVMKTLSLLPRDKVEERVTLHPASAHLGLYARKRVGGTNKKRTSAAVGTGRTSTGGNSSVQSSKGQRRRGRGDDVGSLYFDSTNALREQQITDLSKAGTEIFTSQNDSSSPSPGTRMLSSSKTRPSSFLSPELHHCYSSVDIIRQKKSQSSPIQQPRQKHSDHYVSRNNTLKKRNSKLPSTSPYSPSTNTNANKNDKKWTTEERQKLNELYWELGRPTRPGKIALKQLLSHYVKRHLIFYKHRSPRDIEKRVRHAFLYNQFKEKGECEHWRQRQGR